MNDKICLVCVLAAFAAACSSKSDASSKDKAASEPFEVTVHKVEQQAVVAPNKAWEEQGLASKASDGKTFVCVQLSVTNKAEKAELLPAPRLVDGKAAIIDLDGKATANYQPEDWKADPGRRLEPGKQHKDTACFEVASDATTGMKLQFEREAWGRKAGWKLEMALP